jgi:predicted nucleotidyltransferase
MDLTEQQVRYIQEWAERAGVVVTVRLYGSRAKGSARSDSDVNLALTVGTSHYVRFLNEWQKELSGALILKVNVEAIQFPGRRHRPPLLRRVQRGAVPEISGRLS